MAEENNQVIEKKEELNSSPVLDVKDAKKKKKKNKKGEKEFDIFEEEPEKIEDPKVKKEKDIQDAVAFHEFAECNRLRKKVNRTALVYIIYVLCLFLFVGGSYLAFNYADTPWWNVDKKNHTHQYKSVPDYIFDGDCQTHPYKEYHCTYPGCSEKYTIEMETYGNHKYDFDAQVKREVDGVEYWVYTCKLCGKENLTPVVTEENGG